MSRLSPNSSEFYLRAKPVREVDPDDHADYRESKEFIAYQVRVVRVLSKAKHPIPVRRIHEALGEHKIERWTMDVLEVTNFVMRIPGYIDLYAYEPGVQVRDTTDMSFSDVNSRIFAGNGKKRFEAAR
jgi:hypothetical protein